MSTSSNDVVVEVPEGESGVSANKIKTDCLGPCLGFLIDFKYEGEDRCVLSHYSFSINEEIFNTYSALLVAILNYIAAELQFCLKIDEFKSNGKIRLSNIRLLIAGGAIQTSQRIENVLSMLNSGVDFNIQQLTDDEELLFLHNELINNPGRTIRSVYGLYGIKTDRILTVILPVKPPFCHGLHSKNAL